MTNRENGSVIIYVLIAVIVIALAGLAVYYILEESDIKNKEITAENINEILEVIEKRAKKDEELYYVNYAMMYHIMQNGIADQNANQKDKNEIYKNIYGKTVKELINEGKELMQKNDITLEQFKSGVQGIGN